MNLVARRWSHKGSAIKESSNRPYVTSPDFPIPCFFVFLVELILIVIIIIDIDYYDGTLITNNTTIIRRIFLRIKEKGKGGEIGKTKLVVH